LVATRVQATDAAALTIVYRYKCSFGERCAFARLDSAFWRRSSSALVESHLCGGVAADFHNGVSDQKKATRFYVSGLVQGVGYRYFARRAAQQLGVAGYAKNLSDGRVEVYAIGAEAQLRALREDLRQGPRHALIEEIAEAEADLLQEFMSDFSIEY